MSVVEDKLLTDNAAPVSQQTDYLLCDTEPATYNRDIFNRIRTRDLCRLARQLATLLRAGMPLVPALSALVEQLRVVPRLKVTYSGSRQHRLEKIMGQVHDDVNDGSTLSCALDRHPDVFSPLFVNMVAAGENSGKLEQVLVQLAEMLEKRVHLVAKVKSAVTYPLMMIVVAAGVVVFLLSYVVPSITQIFLEMNQTVPLPTKLLISTSTFIKSYLMLFVIFGGVVCFAIAAGCRTKQARYYVDSLKLKLPLFGKLLLKLEIARLTRTFGVLLSSGVPILNALQIAKAVVRNSLITEAMDSVRDLVRRGDNLANAMRGTGLFPPIVFHIISTGQMSGTIEQGLMNIADIYDDEVEMTTKTLTSLLEPAILLVMGAVVGFIVLAILLPIFEINQAF